MSTPPGAIDTVVVLTGASSGIGAALARKLGARGAKLVLAARRSGALAEVARASGPSVEVVVADVTRRADVDRIRDAALARFGRIDALVNNAGRGISRAVADLTDEDIDEMMAVNLKSALYGMQAVLPHFLVRRRGHIVNVSSVLGRVPLVSARSAYSAAKHALGALTANLRMDLRRDYPDVHVSTVFPGVVATGFGLAARGGGVDSRRIPDAQDPDEVADVIVDLLERPRPEVYTRDADAALVTGYYADPGAAERGPRFLPMPVAHPTETRVRELLSARGGAAEHGDGAPRTDGGRGPDFDAVLARVLGDFGCQVGTLHGLDAASGQLTLVAQRGVPPQILDKVRRIPIGKGMAGIAAERRQPVQVCNLQTDASGVTKPSARETRMEGSITVPLLVDGELRGTLGVAKSVEYDFSPAETDLLLRLGALIGAALPAPR